MDQSFTYGRYYYGEEAVSGNDGNNIQYYRRETYGRGLHPPTTSSTESRQILGPQADITNNGYNDSPRPDSGTYSQNVFAHGSPMMNAPPSMHSLPQRSHEGNGGNGAGFPAFSPESYARNVYGRRSPITTHSFQPRPYEVDGYNGYNSPGSYAHTVHGRGSPMMNASTNSYYFDRHGGYHDIPVAQHGSHMINAPPPMHSFHRNPNGGNTAYYHDYNGVPAHDQNRHNSHFRVPSFQPLSNVHTRDDSVHSYENIDQSLNNERLKLVTRIKKCFKETAKDTFEKNSSLFDGQDWIKVTYVFSDGMKIYVAEMICPICHGKVSPQNKEKEAGRLPKWDLYSVKRHVITVHCKKELPDEKTAPSHLPTKENFQLPEQEEEKMEMPESSDEKIAEKNNSPSVTGNIQLPSEKSSSEDSSSDFPSSIIGDESDSADPETDSKNVKEKTSEKVTKKRILEKSIDQRKSESTSESENDIRGKISNEQKKKIGKRRRTEKSVNSPGNSCSDSKKGKKTAKKQKKKSDKLQQMDESSSSESESNSTEIAQWKKPGVTFGWVKMTVKSRFQPAFIFPKPKDEEKPRAQYIQMNGDLSDLTHPVEQVATPEEVELVKRSRKSQNYLTAIKKFNVKHKCNYTPNGLQS